MADANERQLDSDVRPPLVNGYVALEFEELATLLELLGESAFRTRAYRNFAELLRSLPESISAVRARGELGALAGVGKAIAAKVEQLARDGRIEALERARAEVPPRLVELLRIAGLGPAKARKLWREGGITSLEELRDACREGRVAAIGGFSARAQEKLLPLIEAALETRRYALLAEGLTLAAQLLDDLARVGATLARTAGALRRGVEIVDELVVVVAGLAPSEVARAITEGNALDARARVELEPRASWPAAQVLARLADGRGPKIRVRCASEQGFAEAMVIETADPAHLEALSRRAEELETSLHSIAAGTRDEDEIYLALGLPRTPPELREGALLGAVPDGLLPPRGVRGVFHVHTSWSDGTGSIVEMARAAREAGFEYVGISDHSRAASYANGLDEARLREQALAVEVARREVRGIEIFHGVEVDVMVDGALDLPDDALAGLDFVVASIHTALQLDHAAQTRRILRAVSHPLVTVLGHPTGRLLLARPGYSFDLEAVADAAAANGTFLEINASPGRLDLSPPLVRRAAARGARFCINPDAHEARGFGDVALGVAQARRAGLRVDQVLNGEGASAVTATLRARRASARARLGRPER